MPRVTPLERADLREAWPHEEHDFTPWLAENIELLAKELGLRLEQVEREVRLPLAGRVDLRALQSRTGAKVVIENQLGWSDDSHCLRLLGYAADSDASILVWVAAGFSRYHRRIVEWLNESDTIALYAVQVRAWRVGDRLAFDFRTMVAPTQNGHRSGPKHINTLYAEFYRPLVARLARNDLHPVGKGGWRGRYRSFQTGHAGAVYGTALDQNEEKLRVGFFLDETYRRERRAALRERESAITAKVGRPVSWWDDGFVLWGPRGISVAEASEEEMEAARKWLEQNLLSLRTAVGPHLEEVMRAGASGSDAAQGAD